MTPRPVVVTIAVLGLLALSGSFPLGAALALPPARLGPGPSHGVLGLAADHRVLPSPFRAPATPFELRLSAGPVNPQGSYSAEPAPMGVADFGIDGQGQPYSYSTSTFVGTTNITSLKANDMGNPSAGNVAFELNTVLTFQVGSKNYVYWLQDGFDVESHSEHVALLQDYVWNFSTSSASLNASSVAGNGSFVNYGGYDVYITYPSKTLPGYNVTLGFPMVLELRIVSGTAGVQGVPWVGYDYNDGFGWVRGANVSFPFAVGALGVGQTVNGSTYTPHGAYYDAEFDYAGPGGGVGIDVGSHMQITLDRWTGHNLAPVPNAYNHGGNTGEKIENLTVVSSGALGAPGSSVSPGAGTLGLLYSSNQTAQLRVTAPWASGAIGVNGVPVAFTGGEADLTLVPGSYELTLYQGSTIVGHSGVLLVAGSNGTVELVANLLEPVTVAAPGLPSGTAWSIWWNGTRYNGTSPSILVSSLNGTYPLTTSAIPGFVPKVTELSVAVKGPTTATLAWTTFNFTVTFDAAGLPAGTAWWVTSGGVENRSNRIDPHARAAERDEPVHRRVRLRVLPGVGRRECHGRGGADDPDALLRSEAILPRWDRHSGGCRGRGQWRGSARRWRLVQRHGAPRAVPDHRDAVGLHGLLPERHDDRGERHVGHDPSQSPADELSIALHGRPIDRGSCAPRRGGGCRRDRGRGRLRATTPSYSPARTLSEAASPYGSAHGLEADGPVGSSCVPRSDSLSTGPPCPASMAKVARPPGAWSILKESAKVRAWHEARSLRSQLSADNDARKLRLLLERIELNPETVVQMASKNPDRLREILVRYAARLKKAGKLDSTIVKSLGRASQLPRVPPRQLRRLPKARADSGGEPVT